MNSDNPSSLASLIPAEVRGGGLLPIVVIGAVALVAGGLISKTVNDYEQAAFIEMTAAFEGMTTKMKHFVSSKSPAATTKTETRKSP